MSLALYYEQFRSLAVSGALCEGAECSGWHLSEVDTWHACGACNRDERRVWHPEADYAEVLEWTPVELPPVDPDDDLPF